MAENWNVENVAESKPGAPAEKPTAPAAAAIPSVLSNDHSLGKIMSIARENRGLSREQAAKSSNIPGYYLTMIESDDYSSIADQLYLLPFLRRYATFVGLEPEEVASRFIRDVQRADMNPGRVSEPIVMIADRKTFPWNTVLLATGGAIVVIAIVWFSYRHFASRKSVATNVSPPVAVEPQAAPAKPESAAKPVAAKPAYNTDASDEVPAAKAPAPVSSPATSKSSASRPRLSTKPH
jgi:cytoskeletal protein RodZ